MASTAAADASPSSSFDVGRWLKTHPAFGFPPAAYSQPTHLGLGWTTAGSHHKHGDASGLQPIRLPNQLPLDLNEWEGERYIPKPNIHSGVEIVIAEAIAAGASPHECDIITFRNNLNKILGTPCNIKSGWAVNAVCLNSTLFLDIVKQENEWESSPEAAKFDFWGRAFEAACTGQHVADASKEWGMLVSARLNGLRVLMGAEVDCYDDSECPPGKKPPMSSLRELKTYREPQHVGHWKSIHRHKHPKWWLQSFLAGVPALVLGARDDQVGKTGVDIWFSGYLLEYLVQPAEIICIN